jgi:excisionase family DNA binding protein
MTPAGAGPQPRLLTTREVAAFLRVHAKTVPRLIEREGLPCLRIGSRFRFDPSDLQRWLSARKEG